LPGVAAHYWDPTDYIKDIAIPPELLPRKEQDHDALDKLDFAVNEHYCWNFNFKSRWLFDQEATCDFLNSQEYFTNSQA
jgi:hypothetical protein